MALIEINWKPTEREARQFSVIWLPAFLATVGALVFWKFDSRSAAVAFWSAAAGVSVLGGLLPVVRRPIFVGWMCAAFPIGWTISHVLLACIFFLIITPIGCLLRLCGHDPLKRKFDRTASTYWVPHSAGEKNDRYFRQF